MADGLSINTLTVNLRAFEKSPPNDLSVSVPKEAPLKDQETKEPEIPSSALNEVNLNLPSATLEHSLPFNFPEKIQPKKEFFTSSEKNKMELNIDGKSILSFKLNGDDTNPKVKVDSPLLKEYAKNSILEPLKSNFENAPTAGKALAFIAGMATSRALGLSVPVKLPDLTIAGKALETSIRTDLKKDTTANFTYGNISLSVNSQRSFNVNYTVPLF